MIVFVSTLIKEIWYFQKIKKKKKKEKSKFCFYMLHIKCRNLLWQWWLKNNANKDEVNSAIW